MKHLFTTMSVLLMACAALTANAQEKQARGERQMPAPEERIQKQAMAMARQLDLADDVAEQFVEIYRQYKSESLALNGVRDRSGRDGAVKGAELSDEEADAKIRKDFDKERKTLELKESYYEKFLTVLTPKQVLKLYSMEKGFTGRGSQRPGASEGRPGHGNFDGFGDPAVRSGRANFGGNDGFAGGRDMTMPR